MFTEQDIKRMKKLNIEYYEKKQSESNGSSMMQEKSEDDLYFSKYFLNDCFKILHIEIVSTEEVTASFARQESYMTYTVLVVTQEFSYEIKKRYSQFLRLYQSIVRQEQLRNRSEQDPKLQITHVGKIDKLQYTFPPKKLSSSLLNFFNKSNKEKLAQERKSDLSSFLNQIRSNYYKFPKQFAQHYVQLLKFINMKEEHQKYWRRKEGRYLELSNLTLKDTNLPNPTTKTNQKQGDTNQVNIDHLSQLLQHQMNKINLAVMANESLRKSNCRLSQTQQISSQNDPMVTDQIIKNVDCIQDIVLEMKRKINYDHIRCILKGKDIKQDTNAPLSKPKKGLIEYSLKYATNELVSIHILKTILNVFMNSECNYSCDAFVKVLGEIQLGVFVLGEDMEMVVLGNREIRDLYFKLLKQYGNAKEQYGSEKRGVNLPLDKMMGLVLVNMYHNWCSNSQKTKQFKLKQQQKQWTLIIDDSTRYSPKKTLQIPQIPSSSTSPKKYTKFHESPSLTLSLLTQHTHQYSRYFLKANLTNKSYRQCVEIMKDEKCWNPVLVRSQIDIYSHTKKDVMKIAGKQEKIFRFVETQEIQMELNDADKDNKEEGDLVVFENVVLDQNQDKGWVGDEKDPKMSTQTMPSTSGSCAYEHSPQLLLQQKPQILSHSLDSYQTTFIKSPPKEPSILSYHQRIKIERLPQPHNPTHPIHHCHPTHLNPNPTTTPQQSTIQIQLIFTQPPAIKYFLSEIEGTTLIIWNGVLRALEGDSFLQVEHLN